MKKVMANKTSDVRDQCFNCAYRLNRNDSFSSCKYNWRASAFDPPDADTGAKKKGFYEFPVCYDPKYQDTKCPAKKDSADPRFTTDPVLTYVLMKN